METIKESYAITHICGNICKIMESAGDISDAKYHHTTSYKDAISVCKYGILTLKELNERGIRHDGEETLRKLSNLDSHPNGIDGISLAIDDVNDVTKKDMYDPRYPTSVDFRISSEVLAYRSSANYDNERICRGSIALSEIKAIDIRMRELCDWLLYTRKLAYNNVTIQTIVNKYNHLIDLAQTLVNGKLDIPLREMSDEDYSIYHIDPIKLSEQSKISITKN